MKQQQRAVFTALFLASSITAGCGGSDGGGTPASSGGAGGGSAQGGSGGTRNGGAPGTGGSSSGTGGASSNGGSTGNGGASGGSAGSGSGTGGAAGRGGSGGSAGSAGGRDGGSFPDVSGGTDAQGDPKFSFFVISMKALQDFSGKPEGFGGDLRFGQADGLAGADELCRQAAERGSRGAGQKKWRALLSATTGPGGMPVHARERIGPGPWHDVMGRMIAPDLASLFAGERPPAVSNVANDLPNERGEPNHFVGRNGLQAQAVDNHDTLTGSNAMGRLNGALADTCNDWTSTTATGSPSIGHSWPRGANSGRHWVADHRVPGCAPGVDTTLGGNRVSARCVGCSGGYGGFYCFATP